MNSRSLGENENKPNRSVALVSALESSKSSDIYCDLEFLIETASRYK